MEPATGISAVMRIAHLFVLTTLLASHTALAACTTESGPRRNHLLELYTSQGCSSCPPADRYLSGLKGQAGVVPLAFHVDYWNSLGWRDPYSQAAYSQRQRDYARASGSRTVYTPQFILNGRDWRQGRSDPPWRQDAANAPTRISLRLDRAAPGSLRVSGRLSGRAGQVWLALYENNLETAVPAGENAGRRLKHDFVVRELAGPLAATGSQYTYLFQVPPEQGPRDLGVAAFVTDATGVLQAVRLTGCP